MASTFSPSLRIELIGNGDQSGVWGQTTNSNLGTIIEQAITGVESITMVNTDYFLSNFNGVSDEARNAVLVVGGTNSAIRKVVAPLTNKTYTIRNNTVGGFAINIGGSTGTAVLVPNGVTAQVYCDGTDFYEGLSGVSSNFTVPNNLTVGGTTTLTGALGGSTAVFSGAISSVSPAFTGTPTAPTAAPGTNTTQLATTAFVLVNGVPSGAIIMWSGSIASIPSGWLLCNGSSGTPDLRDRFVVGAGSTYAVAATGGSANAVVVSHTHTYSGTTGDDSPDHSHLSNATGLVNNNINFVGTGGANYRNANDTQTGGASNRHQHSFSGTTASAGVSGTNANLPPYYALAYIMKT
jgi:microcystin-dependent protein